MTFSEPDSWALKPTPRASSAHQRGLAGAVGADDSQSCAVVHVEGDILDRLDQAHGALTAAEAGDGGFEGRGALEGRAVGH
jgi:hypothetical protein